MTTVSICPATLASLPDWPPTSGKESGTLCGLTSRWTHTDTQARSQLASRFVPPWDRAANVRPKPVVAPQRQLSLGGEFERCDPGRVRYAGEMFSGRVIAKESIGGGPGQCGGPVGEVLPVGG
jgi:hypothetical protein